MYWLVPIGYSEVVMWATSKWFSLLHDQYVMVTFGVVLTIASNVAFAKVILVGNLSILALLYFIRKDLRCWQGFNDCVKSICKSLSLSGGTLYFKSSTLYIIWYWFYGNLLRTFACRYLYVFIFIISFMYLFKKNAFSCFHLPPLFKLFSVFRQFWQN